MPSPHDNLKKEFEEFRDSVIGELITGPTESPISKITAIENRLTRIEKFIFDDTTPSKIIMPGG